MGGKSMKAMRDTSVDNENFNAAEVTSAVSILSGQSGSPRENQDGGLGVTDLAPKVLEEENACSQTLENSSDNSEALFLDMIRKKLMSDFSSGIFHSNLETETDKKDTTLINIERLSVIEQILVQIYLLSDPEKLLLYLKLPNSENNLSDPLNLPLDLLGNQQEIQQAIVWIKTHLREIEEKSILDEDIYDQYIGYCRNGSMKALSTSDFGKVMKQVYPVIRPRRLGTRDYGTVSTEINEGGTQDHKNKLNTPSKCPKIPSATVVKDPTPEESKLSDVDLNFTNDLNTDGENQDNLGLPLLRSPTTNIDNINCALGKDSDILPDNAAEVTENDFTNNKTPVNFPDKVQLNNEELNVKGADEGDKSNEVNSTQNVKSAESESNTFFHTRLPLKVFKRIIQIASLKRMNSQRTPRSRGRKSSPRSQRFRARRSQLQSQRSRRRRYVSIRSELADGGAYWLNIQSVLRNKRNEIAGLPRIKDERVKYFGHLADTDLLGVVGETMVNKLLKLKIEQIAENIFSGLQNIRAARNQSCLESTSGAHTPVENAVQGGLPQRSQNSDEYSTEPTVTFQNQGDLEYFSNHHLLISDTENMVNLNTVELNTQNNAFIDTRRENPSVTSSTNYFHFVHIFPGPGTSFLTQETVPFLSHQTAQTMLNNNFLPPSNCSCPRSYIIPFNHGFLLSNNVLPPNNNPISSDYTFLPENNNHLNGFDNMNTEILNGAFNSQNNIFVEGTSPSSTPGIGPENYSANFYPLNAPENFHEISTFHQFLPDEANFNQAPMETNFAFQNLSEEIDQLLIDQPNFEDTRASITRSQLAPVNSMTDEEFWFPNYNDCNDINDTLDGYSKEQTNPLDSCEQSFEPISDCQTRGPVVESEPFPMLSLDDLATDSDDITDQLFCHNFVSDSNDFNFDNNSLDTLPGRIDDNNVTESSFSTEDFNSYLKPSEGPSNPTDSLLELEAGDIDCFDNLFDDSAENSEDHGEGALTLVTNEYTSYHESPLDIFSHGDGTNHQSNEHLGLNESMENMEDLKSTFSTYFDCLDLPA